MDEHDRWGIELLIKETTNHLEASVQALRDLDRRIEGLARFDAILLGIVIAGLSAWTQVGPSITAVPVFILALLGVGILAAGLSISLAVWAYLAQAIAVGLHPRELKEIIADQNNETRAKQILDRYTLAIASNFLLLDKRSQRFRLALLSWILSMIVLSTGAVGLFTSATP